MPKMQPGPLQPGNSFYWWQLTPEEGRDKGERRGGWMDRKVKREKGREERRGRSGRQKTTCKKQVVREEGIHPPHSPNLQQMEGTASEGQHQRWSGWQRP